MHTRTRIVSVVVLLGAVVFATIRYAARRATADDRYHGDAAHKIFDPSRDAFKDLQAAEQQARSQGKNILLDVGGNWCPSCLVLEGTMRAEPAVHTLLESKFVVMHVNWSTENRNQAFLSRYPAAKGFPALYVLAPDGHLIKAEETSELERPGESGGYDQSRLQAFLFQYRLR